ncbi:hypothetical protein ACFSTE_21085 [Aquimarina hainanensis]|uniref:MotA/TolQ/ExbB proton channel domain-containing protein n=1 Tax=Aquimarina hainanensis TaxID=1578017 RepID=A0ABW5NEA4_9FLAO
MSIEEILKLDKKITFRNLIYSKYEFTWGLIGLSLFLIGMSIMLYWIFNGFKIKEVWCLPIGVIFYIISGMYLMDKNKRVIKKHYKHSLLENGNWDYSSLVKIRMKIIKKEIKGKIDLSNDNLLFIIDSLKNNSEINKYNYFILTNGIVMILSVCVGAFLGGFSNFANGFEDYLKAFKLIAGISLMFISLLVYMEMAFFKEYAISRKKHKNRLIRVFENIYLKKNAR